MVTNIYCLDEDVKRKAKDNGVPEGTEKSRKRVTTTDDLSAKRTTLMKAKQGKEVCLLGYVIVNQLLVCNNMHIHIESTTPT